MNDLIRRLDAMPVTAIVALLYVTFAFLTDPVSPTYQQLVHFGGARGIDVGNGDAWRLVSYAFLHGSALHLLFNMWSLIQLGPATEAALGSVRFASLYVVGAIGAGIAGCLWHDPRSPLVGGSGALFAMDGAMIAFHARQGGSPSGHVHVAISKQWLSIAAMNLLLGALIPYVSNAAHIGGLLTGMLFVFVTTTGPRGERPRIGVAAAGCIALVLSLLALCIRPVHRWDYQLLLWGRATDPTARDAHAAAFLQAFVGNTDGYRDEVGMQRAHAELQEMLRNDR